jgi:hypothetical protein
VASLRGGKVKSLKSLKAGLKKGGGNQYLTRVGEDGLTVRFLTEPDEWVEFFEHYDDVRKFYPCTDDCDGCRDKNNPSKRYLVNALDTSEGKVIPLLLAKSAAGQVMKKYDRFNTILDRDYILVREGTGFDTEYDVTPESPSKMNLNRYELLDLWGILEGMLPSDGDEDEDEEEEKPARRRAGGPVKKAAIKRRPVADEDEDEDEPPFARKPVRKPVAKKRIAPKPTTGGSRIVKKTTAPVRRTLRK